MPELRIQRLDVEGFRGILQTRSLVFGGKSILLFGENGTGKSSFIDALEKLLTGQVSTLDGRAQGISSQAHGPHIKSRAGGCRVSVVFTNGTAFDLNTSPSSVPLDAQRYISAARQPVYILRRGKLLNFIECQPRDRYDLLRPFLPLEGAEEIENAFAEARSQSELEESRIRTRVTQLSTELRRSLGLTSADDELTAPLLLAGLNRRLKTASRSDLGGLDGIPQLLKTFDSELSQFGDVSKPTAVMTAIAALRELADELTGLDVQTTLSAVLDLRDREASDAAVIYERVLQEGADWIEKEKRTECPLCEQEMRRFPPDEVVSRARARVEARKERLALRQHVNAQLDACRAAVALLARTAERAQSTVLSIRDERPPDVEEPIRVALQYLKVLTVELGRPMSELDLQKLALLADPSAGRAEWVKAIHSSTSSLQRMLESLPSASSAQNLLQLREWLIHVGLSWKELQQSRHKLSGAQRLSSTARIAHELLKQARKEVVSEIFEEMSEDVDRIYHTLHSHHDTAERAHATHRNLRLELREAVQKSVTIRGDFYESTDVDPRAYYSDAHLDTLGISIFLALRLWYRRQHPAFNLMVLDDVLSSVDSAHAVQLAEVLLKEFSEFQILITTHDRIWFEHLRDIQARCGVAQNFVNKTIYNWTIDSGPEIREPSDEEQRLRELVSTGQPYEMVALAGRLLEHILQEMRYSLRLPVPAKPGEIYEIGDLWPAFHKEVKRNFPQLYSDGKTTFDSLDISWPLRNWVGAHFNRWASNVSADAAKEFAQTVINLFQLLYCPECRRFIAPSSTPLGQIACKCGHRIYAAPDRQRTQTSERTELVHRFAGSLREAKLNTALHLEWKKNETTRED